MNKWAILLFGVVGIALLLYMSGCSYGGSRAPNDEDTTDTIIDLHRAERSARAAVTSGVTYVDFVVLLREMKTEILLATDKDYNSLNENLINKYNEIYEIYKDSRDIWDIELEIKKASDIRLDVLLDRYPHRIDPYISKYNIDVLKYRESYIATRISPSERVLQNFEEGKVYPAILSPSMLREEIWQIAVSKSSQINPFRIDH
ncbi:hypothetical protein [Desulfurivibrio alkaliphilus]|uniref:Uncharacterized protein n=1 Tax=Desulfurivibrio alkaliphilus (strain DSM 19089 / UNIQEM U267 / AHT2) TaxID=589865 RepID=D6Z2D2_DESAT|nr:hypothetical protein [Desulfurivibrio alkaliphilus]ADH85707.1 hypothetical protein DaAHT2_1006 [Desulfurivibrio alkaliphilus AHT 2]